MYKVAGVVLAVVMLTTNGEPLAVAGRTGGESAAREEGVQADVTPLLAAARGAPPLICSIASQSLRNFGWGDWGDAPSPPLSHAILGRNYDFGPEELPAADVQRLLEA